VPETVVDRLKMPHALAGLHVETDEALGKQVVAGAGAAEVVAGWRFEREIDGAEVFVGTDERPHSAVVRGRPRIVPPCVVAQPAGTRNDMKGPEQLAGTHVVATDVVGGHFFRRFGTLVEDIGRRRGYAAHDDHVPDHQRTAGPAITRDRPLVSLREINLPGF